MTESPAPNEPPAETQRPVTDALCASFAHELLVEQMNDASAYSLIEKARTDAASTEDPEQCLLFILLGVAIAWRNTALTLGASPERLRAIFSAGAIIGEVELIASEMGDDDE